MTFYGRKEFDAAAAAVRNRTRHSPRIGIVLGSGLGAFADAVTDADVIPYGDVPHWPVSTVPGHSGQLFIGKLSGHSVAVMRGRTHFYEGYPISQITLPIRVMQRLGVELVILTNAAGGLNPAYRVGDVMAIADHINLIGMGGTNPLVGPNDDTLGPRFPDMNQVYDQALRDEALRIAHDNSIPMHSGVYVCIAGPSFESPADVRFLKAIGADAVGMSTVPEAIVARHGGMRVLGFSGVTNAAIDTNETDAKASHEEVLEAGKLIGPRLMVILNNLLPRIPVSQ